MEEIVLNSGDTAWVLASTALVLLMTPGLAFFISSAVSAIAHPTTYTTTIYTDAVGWQ